MIDNLINTTQWSENVIIADADFIDKVAFDLTVNFERMLMRRIPRADLAKWADCVALDGGVREGKNSVQVVFIHNKSKTAFEYFSPANLADEISGKAFSDNLGEFLFSAYATEEIVSKSDFMEEVVTIASTRKEVKRLMIIPDDEEDYDRVRRILNNTDTEEKRVTLFAMQPMYGGNFNQEILGYSLMSALGIRAGELNEH